MFSLFAPFPRADQWETGKSPSWAHRHKSLLSSQSLLSYQTETLRTRGMEKHPLTSETQSVISYFWERVEAKADWPWGGGQGVFLGPGTLQMSAITWGRTQVRTTTQDLPQTQGSSMELNEAHRAIRPWCRSYPQWRAVVLKTGKLSGSMLGNAVLRKDWQGHWRTGVKAANQRNLASPITGLP